MKKLIILFIICVFSLSSFGQDSVNTRIKEYYLTLADFSPVTLQLKYKRQIAERTYLKLGLVNLSGNTSEQTSQDPNRFGSASYYYSGGLELGIEFRKKLTKQFLLFHGPNLSFSYQKNVIQTFNPAIPTNKQKNIWETYRFSIPYSFGILFNLNSNILIAAELNPNINYNQQIYKDGQNPYLGSVSENIGAGLDNRIVLLSIVYKLQLLRITQPKSNLGILLRHLQKR